MRALRWLFLLLGASAVGAQVSTVDADDEIIFYRSAAWRSDTNSWQIEIRGSVHEPEQRRAAVAILKKLLDVNGVDLTEDQEKALAARARYFMVDNQRGEVVVVTLGGRKFVLKKSGPDGQFAGRFALSDREVGSGQADALFVQAVLPSGDVRAFGGSVELIDDAGTTVFSDIDDTIKITHVLDRKAMLRNTFIEPFQAVPGMAALYTTWSARTNLNFCYVSAGPRQLYGPLRDFLQAEAFPAGILHMRDFRLKDRSFANLLRSPEAYKATVINTWLDRLPGRRAVLVGDSGEKDPEIYARIARARPKQILKVFIRDVNGEFTGSQRCQKVFAGLPSGLCVVFRQAQELGEGW